MARKNITRQLMAGILAISLTCMSLTPVAGGGFFDLLLKPFQFLGRNGLAYAGLYYIVQQNFLKDSKRSSRKNRERQDQGSLIGFLQLPANLRNALLFAFPEEWFRTNLGQPKELVEKASLELERLDAEKASAQLAANRAEPAAMAVAPSGQLDRQVLVLFSGARDIEAADSQNLVPAIDPEVNNAGEFEAIAITLTEVPSVVMAKTLVDGQLVRQLMWEKQKAQEGDVKPQGNLFSIVPLIVDLREVTVKEQLTIKVIGITDDGREFGDELILLVNPTAVQPSVQEEEESAPLLPDMSDGRQIIMPPSRARPVMAKRSQPKQSTQLASRLRSSDDSTEKKGQAIAHLLRSSEEEEGTKSEGTRVASAATLEGVEE